MAIEIKKFADSSGKSKAPLKKKTYDPKTDFAGIGPKKKEIRLVQRKPKYKE